ncbi:MAG: threonylcarbamoyl-AMP synthase [Muribaculaceae bacterium]|nr:threonylcarbamoyl-AMP synthase [Muribaculaceae bacterium]
MATAVKTLQDGGIVIFPTDTLYALGCDALNNRAVERLCSVKGLNPEKHLLSIVCDGISMASEYARIDNKAFRILKGSLPGAYTFILPSSTRLPRAFKGRKSVGVRVPDNDVARELARALGHPLLTTSVEIDDEAEVVEPASIAMHYDGRADIILDNGTGGTVPSTIVDITDAASPEVVRQGAAPFDEN